MVQEIEDNILNGNWKEALNLLKTSEVTARELIEIGIEKNDIAVLLDMMLASYRIKD